VRFIENINFQNFKFLKNFKRMLKLKFHITLACFVFSTYYFVSEYVQFLWFLVCILCDSSTLFHLGRNMLLGGCLSPAVYFSPLLFVWKERYNDSYIGLLINGVRFNSTK